MSNPYQSPAEQLEKRRTRGPVRFLVWTFAMGFFIPMIACSVLVFILCFVSFIEYSSATNAAYDALRGTLKMSKHSLAFSTFISIAITLVVGLALFLKWTVTSRNR